MLARARDACTLRHRTPRRSSRPARAAADDAQDRLRPDHRGEHVAQLAVALDRNAHRDAEVAERAARQRADDRRSRAHHLGEARRIGDRRRRRAEGVTVLKSGTPAGVASSTARHSGRAREHAPRQLVRVGEIDVGRRPERLGERQRLQRRDRQAQLGVDRGRERARQVERRLLGLRRCCCDSACSAMPDISASGRIATRRAAAAGGEAGPAASERQAHAARSADRRIRRKSCTSAILICFCQRRPARGRGA